MDDRRDRKAAVNDQKAQSRARDTRYSQRKAVKGDASSEGPFISLTLYPRRNPIRVPDLLACGEEKIIDMSVRSVT